MSQPSFLPPQYIRRCPDCDLNGFLKADGRRDMKKKYLIDRCSVCGGRGKIHLLTRELLQQQPDRARHLHEVGWYVVSRKETLDPYMLDVPRAAAAGAAVGPQEASEADETANPTEESG